jgi:hypothetical protein
VKVILSICGERHFLRNENYSPKLLFYKPQGYTNTISQKYSQHPQKGNNRSSPLFATATQKTNFLHLKETDTLAQQSTKVPFHRSIYRFQTTETTKKTYHPAKKKTRIFQQQ